LLAAPGAGIGTSSSDWGSALMPKLEVRNLQGGLLSTASADRKGAFNFAESVQHPLLPLLDRAPMIQAAFRAPAAGDYDIVVAAPRSRRSQPPVPRERGEEGRLRGAVHAGRARPVLGQRRDSRHAGGVDPHRAPRRRRGHGRPRRGATGGGPGRERREEEADLEAPVTSGRWKSYLFAFGLVGMMCLVAIRLLRADSPAVEPAS